MQTPHKCTFPQIRTTSQLKTLSVAVFKNKINFKIKDIQLINVCIHTPKIVIQQIDNVTINISFGQHMF